MTSRKHRQIFIWSNYSQASRRLRIIAQFEVSYLSYCFPYRNYGCKTVEDTVGVAHYTFTFKSSNGSSEYTNAYGILQPDKLQKWDFLKDRQPLNIQANAVINFLQESSPDEYQSLIRIKNFPIHSYKFRKSLFLISDVGK